MKNKNLFIGLIILFVGVVALLASLGVFEFHWTILWRLWPVMLMIIGISLLPMKDYIKGILLLVALALGCLLYHNELKDYEGGPLSRLFHNHFSSWVYDDDEDRDEADEEYPMEQHFSEPYSDVERASIDIDFGAGDLELLPPCVELANVDAVSNFVKYSLRTEPRDNEASLYLSGEGHTRTLQKKSRNDVEIALCAQPVWSFSLDMGAANADLDFTPYKMEYISIDGGACNIDLRLGDSGCNTTVEISTGAADIDIAVPSTVDCRINIDSAITGKDLTGFEKVESGVWQTPGFGHGTNQIVIDLSCAVSDLSVKRY